MVDKENVVVCGILWWLLWCVCGFIKIFIMIRYCGSVCYINEFGLLYGKRFLGYFSDIYEFVIVK